MPRAVDPGLFGQQLPIDHSPLSRINSNVVKPGLDFDLGDLIEGAIRFIEDYIFPAIEDLTGIDLSIFLPLLHLLELDFSSPAAFLLSLVQSIKNLPEVLLELLLGLIEALIHPDNSDMLTDLAIAIISLLASLPALIAELAETLISSGAGLLGVESPLNALNLFNNIPQTILGFIPFSAIGEATPNLLANPGFDGATSVQGAAMWFWNGLVGHTTPGSVYTPASGMLKQLRSNTIPVSIDQELTISVWSSWSGLVYTGTPIRLQVVRFLDGNEVGVDNLAAPTAPATNQATWLEIGADYTVPGGCDNICLQLVVTATATAGTIRFDDGNVQKTGSTATFVPFWNVLGVGGPANIGESVFATWNQLVAGFVDTPGGTGAGLADMFGIGNLISSWSSLGRFSFDILGIRNNKPIDSGLLATSASNFSLGRVAMQASAPTINVTQSVSAIGFLRMAESNDKGVVSWLGSGTTNVTGCYINIWQMNPATGDMTLMHRSPNIVGNLSASMAWVIYDYSTAMLPTNAGELYGIEITITGTGTHTVTGTTTWIPPHPTTFPKGYAATRNSGTGTPTIGTVITNASVTYSSDVPWIEWGITAGVGTAPHPDQTVLVNDAGAVSIPIPTWADYIDIIALGGGGGGGQGGVFGIPGATGGGPGGWATTTWARGVDFTTATTVAVTIGAGGPPMAGNGENTVVSVPGHTITGTGGIQQGSGNQYGVEAGDHVYRGITYTGGGPQYGQGADGAPPGGGGASGTDFGAGIGGAGAVGAAWVVFRETI
jgi:hypothetical protein